MSYQPGKMGTAEGMAIVFLLTFPTTFLTTPAVLINEAGALGWLAALIHGGISLLSLLAVLFVCKHVPGNLFEVCEQLLGSVVAWIIALYYALAFSVNYILMLRQYAENTLLTALPMTEFSFVILAYSLVVGIVVAFSLEGMARAGYILMPFIAVTLLIVFILLNPFYEIYRLAPWLSMGLGTTLFTGAKFAGINFGVVAIAIVASSFQNSRTRWQVALFGLGLSTVLRAVVVFFYTLLFGVTVGREKMLPFFEMVRLVYLGRYVQRLESLFIILWVINGLLDIAFSLYFALYCITYLGKLPTMRPLIPVVTILLAHVAMIPEDVVSVMMDYAFVGKTFLNIGIYAVPLLLLAGLGWKKRKKVKIWAAG
ncbi:MAG: Spore germination protein [Anaerospora sp.]|jgi:spore germination protein (amino acid permease)|nr:Spore germination protein [Anaerospora sp.]